jgi:N-acyl-D-aspartate/D-glutamate deacylase
LIATGLRADLTLIDYEALSFNMPTMAYDFPANGRRLVQHAKGCEATFVNAVQIVASDEFTGTLPRKLLPGRR